jgi:hypothetical protein
MARPPTDTEASAALINRIPYQSLLAPPVRRGGDEDRVREEHDHREADRDGGDRTDEAIGHDRVEEARAEAAFERRPPDGERLAGTREEQTHQRHADRTARRDHRRRVAAGVEGELRGGRRGRDRRRGQEHEQHADEGPSGGLAGRPGAQVGWTGQAPPLRHRSTPPVPSRAAGA